MPDGCRAVRAGRSFLRRLLDLSMTIKQLNRRVHLNVSAGADIKWWWQFCLHWNRLSMMRSVVAAEQPQVELVSNASGLWGCRATWAAKWFQLSWESLADGREWNIMLKELLTIVVAAAVWGPQWRGLTVRARYNNMSVVATIKTGSCKKACTMHLRRCLAHLEAVGVYSDSRTCERKRQRHHHNKG